MPYTWSEDDAEKLIILYGQHQCLWNPFHSKFNSKSLRYEAYKTIKNSMNIPGLTICDCIKKITNVKKEYCYELSKIAAAISYEKLYIPKVKWFKIIHMLFFPYASISHDSFKKRDNNVEKYNNDSIPDKVMHSGRHTEKSKSIHFCSHDTCGICELEEVELCSRLRDNVPSLPKLQDAFVSSDIIRTIDVATETNNNIITKFERQTQYVTDDNEGKQVSMY